MRGATRTAATKERAACWLASSKSSPKAWPISFFASLPSSEDAAGLASIDALAAGVDDQHRLAGELEQQSIALFSVANARVFALHRLLRLGETLLQGRHGAQIAADGDEPPIVAVAERAVAHGKIGAFRRRDN